MFANIYKTRLLCSVRSVDVLVWTWIFPFMLATLFHFAFANLDTAGTFQPIQTAVINNEAYGADGTFRTVLETLSADGADQMLDLTIVNSEQEADELLRGGEIAGYITPGKDLKLTVRESGVEQSILQNLLDTYGQRASAIGDIIARNPGAAANLLQAGQDSYTQSPADGGQERSSAVSYFFALIGMVCLYACFQGLTTVTNIQANLSRLGARVSLAPVSKIKLIVYDSLGGLTVHYISCALVALYICLLTEIDLLHDFPLILVVCLAGSLVGYALGTAVGAIGRMKENMKSGILIVVSITLSFMAGMMIEGINYLIQKQAPILGWINPAARVADALYRLYYYNTYGLYLLDLAILITMAAVLFLISAILLRRRKYESI